ncbi:MAG: septum formation initiator family protein [Candidatus Binatia bacterium]
MPQSRICRRLLTYTLAALLATFSLFTTFGDRGLLHLWRLSKAKGRLDRKNLRLQRENEILRKRIDRLRHDYRYLEKIAREDLGLVQQGEIVYRFASSESKERRIKDVKDAPP